MSNIMPAVSEQRGLTDAQQVIVEAMQSGAVLMQRHKGAAAIYLSTDPIHAPPIPASTLQRLLACGVVRHARVTSGAIDVYELMDDFKC